VEQATELSQLTVEPMTNGPFALFEYEKALPRVKLMPRWEVVTNDVACLERLVSDAFDPRQLLLVSDAVSAPAGPVDADDGGSVVIEQYEPKRVALKAVVDAPSILLLNDRYHPDWSVYVNGEKRDLLRCNYIMRGVRLEPGEQVVEFRFQPGFGAIYISLAAILFGLILLTRVTWLTWREAPGPSDEGSGQTERTQGKPRRH
jgi:hypothetical protein